MFTHFQINSAVKASLGISYGAEASNIEATHLWYGVRHDKDYILRFIALEIKTFTAATRLKINFFTILTYEISKKP